ncbi:MAG: peptidylprolyl isomerase [Phycisphaerales bacterium]|nr:MAG: peptidylprolyl isomerase [Phycisphaerales bacterium]
MTRFLMIMASTLAVSVTTLADDTKDAGGAAEKNAGLLPLVKVETTLGDFVLELNGEKAPTSVMNFIWYAEDGYYNGTIFHRVIPDKYIQAGGYLPNLDKKIKGLRPGIPNEWNNGLTHEKWNIAYSRKLKFPNSATSQFLIHVEDNYDMALPRPDGAGYAVFGKVVDGFDAVKRIRDAKTTTDGKYGGTASTVPAEPIVIKSVKVLLDFDRKTLEAIAHKRIAELQDERERVKTETIKELQPVIAELEAEANQKLIVTESGLMYVDVLRGGGPSPGIKDTVTAHFVTRLLDGTEIANSYVKDQPSVFRLLDTVPGWREGMLTMRVGGKRKMIVPADLAYGPVGLKGVVPQNATMVYEVKLISIEPEENESAATEGKGK